MPFPPLNESGVLPPYSGTDPGHGGLTPYRATILEVAERFCTSAHRVSLFRGLLQFRGDLRGAGVPEGLQWIDGSFCENVEATRGRPPKDIDVLNFVLRPPQATMTPAWAVFVADRPQLFHPPTVKQTYGCEVFPLDLAQPLTAVIEQITYWLGLFSHQRETFLWKGMVQVPLHSNDADAEAYINALVFPP